MAPLIPRIESAEVGSKPLAYLIRPGSDFRGDRIRCDTGPSLTSEGSAMSLPSLGSAVRSGVTCGSPWNRKGMVSRSVLSTNTKQASPERVRRHVKIQRARTVVGSAMRCITGISIAQFTSS